jgi:hypothetical protein
MGIELNFIFLFGLKLAGDFKNITIKGYTHMSLPDFFIWNNPKYDLILFPFIKDLFLNK